MPVKEAIMELRNHKKSTIRDIAKTLGVSKSTVLYIVKKQERTGGLSNSKRSGRPRKTTVMDDQKMFAILEKNPSSTVEQIKITLQNVGIEVSESTIKRRLHQQKIRGFTSAYRPMVCEETNPMGNTLPVTNFLGWCEEMGLELSPKVYISSEGTVAQYGMMAREDILVGEVLFSIPRSALLSQNTTRVHDLLLKEQETLASPSGWVPLLIALMYEATDSGSPWAPYFGLWPVLDPPDLPMFWSDKEKTTLLQGTGVSEAVKKDLENMEQEYESIVLPFIQRHPHLFNPEEHSLDLYKRLVAFVMAYSFQESLEEEEEDSGKEDNPPMMVPVADLLNHVAQHNAHLEFTPDYLRMITTRPVQAGQELFNTYGQMANWQLLHMYGFTEPHPQNSNDTADIQMTTLRKAALYAATSEDGCARVQERWDLLCDMEMVGEEGAFVFGCEEVMTDEELRTCLKVLCMSAEEFAEYKENEGWEEDEDDDDEQTLIMEDLSRLPAPWRQLLHASTILTLKDFASDLDSDHAMITNAATYAKLSVRERHALQVRYGQKRILHRILELTN
ncbi:N-lysine methyltransferase setd6 [Pelobates cultripes]|nr:N-lysine methyltransferase setd6 [Pelobates cultripes]